MSIRGLKAALLLAVALGVRAQAPALDPDRLAPKDLEGPSILQLLRRGHQHHQAGRLAEAMADWIELARRRPEGGVGFYNLACVYGRMENPEQAARFLEAAWKHGFRDLELAGQDRDFAKVRSAPVFKNALARLQEQARKDAGEAGRLLQVPAKAWHPLRVLAPPRLEAGQALPLLLVLHGAGDTALGMLEFGKAFAAQGFLVGLVEGQYPVRDGMFPGGALHYLTKPGAARAPEEETLRLAEDYVLAAVETVRKRYPVHPGKVFLTGFSQGAMLAYSLGLRHGDRFRGVVPIGGRIVGELPAKPVKGGAWLVCHSPADTAVSDAEHGKSMQVLGGFGIQPEQQRYEGGHVIPPALVARIGSWLKRMAE